jgi:hypothetical protein
VSNTEDVLQWIITNTHQTWVFYGLYCEWAIRTWKNSSASFIRIISLLEWHSPSRSFSRSIRQSHAKALNLALCETSWSGCSEESMPKYLAASLQFVSNASMIGQRAFCLFLEVRFSKSAQASFRYRFEPYVRLCAYDWKTVGLQRVQNIKPNGFSTGLRYRCENSLDDNYGYCCILARILYLMSSVNAEVEVVIAETQSIERSPQRSPPREYICHMINTGTVISSSVCLH